MDIFLPLFDNPPTPIGNTWTFRWPTTLCPHGNLKIWPPPFKNKHFYALTDEMKGLREALWFWFSNDNWVHTVTTKSLTFLISFARVDIGCSTHPPNLDNRDHLADHLPTPCCPHGYWMPPYSLLTIEMHFCVQFELKRVDDFVTWCYMKNMLSNKNKTNVVQ